MHCSPASIRFRPFPSSSSRDISFTARPFKFRTSPLVALPPRSIRRQARLSVPSTAYINYPPLAFSPSLSIKNHSNSAPDRSRSQLETFMLPFVLFLYLLAALDAHALISLAFFRQSFQNHTPVQHLLFHSSDPLIAFHSTLNA